MTPLEIAKKLAADRKAKEDAAKKAETDKKDYNEREKRRLEIHMQTALHEFVTAGFDRVGGKLYKDTRVAAECHVAWNNWEFQGSDESPVQDMDGNVIFYTFYNPDGSVNLLGEGWTTRTEDFDKRLGESMARWL